LLEKVSFCAVDIIGKLLLQFKMEYAII